MLEKRLREIGQDHIAKLLEHSAEFISPDMLRDDLDQVDISLVMKLVKGDHLFKEQEKISVEPASVVPASFTYTEEAALYREHGEDLIRQGRIAALIVAGGQGSRLGIDAPKGIVEVAPLSSKSLFCLHSQKLLALCRKYRTTIPVFIMTSRTNDAQTKTYFSVNDYFGLDKNHVHFFMQGMLPSITPEGKFLLSREGGLFMNPDGHGGTFSALKKNGCLDIMKSRDIEEIFYFQVDNPLVRVCDPLFVGLHNRSIADMSSKVTRKLSYEEKVGVIAQVNGKTQVIEYSDMSDDMRYATDEMEEMLYWAGNLAIHMIRRDFAETFTQEGLLLPYHHADKTIPTLNSNGNPVEEKGIKFETFIFDALPLAEKTITLEVLRDEEFAPVKNMTGEDSLESSREMQSALYRSWLEEAGIKVSKDIKVEISPLFALEKTDILGHISEIPDKIENDIYLKGSDEQG
ncbi:MAG: UDPGP type 1 family protein [Deltaproteobacteria bacterium]|nr:UDPGP type 1 family protein [Deltaproteobacteria bacterium]